MMISHYFDDNGGPAFPEIDWSKVETVKGGYPSDNFMNMTLRDWFAGQALAGYAAFDGSTRPELIAEDIYAMADAMLQARSKP